MRVNICLEQSYVCMKSNSTSNVWIHGESSNDALSKRENFKREQELNTDAIETGEQAKPVHIEIPSEVRHDALYITDRSLTVTQVLEGRINDGENYSKVTAHHVHDGPLKHAMGGKQPLEPTDMNATGPTGVPQEQLYALNQVKHGTALLNHPEYASE